MAGHQPAVPEGGPALVHHLGLTLRSVVVGLLTDHGQHVGLPVLERGVFKQEPEHISKRALREGGLGLFLLRLEGLALPLDLLRRVDP